MNLTEQLVIVERAMEKLIRDWERFFAGDLRLPPKTDRDRLARRLRLLAEDQDGSRAERFRLEQLQHRFMSYSANWERMLREREEGRGRSVAALRELAAAPPLPTNVPESASVDHRETTSLFDRYVAAKQEQGVEVAVDRETFDAELSAKQAKLEEKFGRAVQFDVLVEDGKVRLAARAKKTRAEQE